MKKNINAPCSKIKTFKKYRARDISQCNSDKTSVYAVVINTIYSDITCFCCI